VQVQARESNVYKGETLNFERVQHFGNIEHFLVLVDELGKRGDKKCLWLILRYKIYHQT
jgi:hypothetical protein